MAPSACQPYPTLPVATAQLLLAEKDAALAALAQRLARLEAGQGARAQLQALDAQSARLRVLPPCLTPRLMRCCRLSTSFPRGSAILVDGMFLCRPKQP